MSCSRSGSFTRGFQFFNVACCPCQPVSAAGSFKPGTTHPPPGVVIGTIDRPPATSFRKQTALGADTLLFQLDFSIGGRKPVLFVSSPYRPPILPSTDPFSLRQLRFAGPLPPDADPYFKSEDSHELSSILPLTRNLLASVF